MKFTLKIDSLHEVVQQYTLQPNSYVLDYSIEGKGIESNGAFIHWINYIDKLELGHRYEQQVSTVYLKMLPKMMQIIAVAHPTTQTI